MSHPEQLPGSPEKSVESASDAAREQAERLQNRPEKAGELSPDKQAEQIEKARQEASKEALMSKETGREQKQPNENTSPAIRRVTTKQKEDEYNRTLKRIQSHMTTPSRVFSNVIHLPVVEKVSDVTANTLARPNAILAGGIFAFIATAGVYVLARVFGYPLSGFETIGSFIVGFLVGILYDFFKTMITGKRS